jgi:hypothetical protein
MASISIEAVVSDRLILVEVQPQVAERFLVECAIEPFPICTTPRVESQIVISPEPMTRSDGDCDP